MLRDDCIPADDLRKNIQSNPQVCFSTPTFVRIDNGLLYAAYGVATEATPEGYRIVILAASEPQSTTLA